MKVPIEKFPLLLKLNQNKASGRKSFKLNKRLNLRYQCGLESRGYCNKTGKRWQVRKERSRL